MADLQAQVVSQRSQMLAMEQMEIAAPPGDSENGHAEDSDSECDHAENNARAQLDRGFFSETLFSDAAVAEEMSKNPEMRALMQDQAKYLKLENKSGMRWHPL